MATAWSTGIPIPTRGAFFIFVITSGAYATSYPLGETCMGALVEWYCQEKTEVFGEKYVPLLLCPQQISHGLARNRNRASTLRRSTTDRLTNLSAVCLNEHRSNSSKPTVTSKFGWLTMDHYWIVSQGTFLLFSKTVAIERSENWTALLMLSS